VVKGNKYVCNLIQKFIIPLSFEDIFLGKWKTDSSASFSLVVSLAGNMA